MLGFTGEPKVFPRSTRGKREGEGTMTIDALDLRVGDIVDYHGEHHQVEHVERFDGWSWPVASDGAGWAMALGGDVVLVARAA